MRKIILAYIPVLHAGYLDLFDRHKDADCLALFDSDTIAMFDHLARKDIRAVSPALMQRALSTIETLPRVLLLSEGLLSEVRLRRPVVVMPDEDESRVVAEIYLPGVEIVYDSAFLRWDKTRASKQKEVSYEGVISSSGFDRELMKIAQVESGRSSDWWRQVGALIVKDGDLILVAHNEHWPHPQSPNVLGDTRALFNKGVHIELTTAVHAEASVIAEAARRGISLQSAVIYVSTFPCPMCARLIAHSGIQTCYFADGYAMLDGEEILKRAGVSLVRVENAPSNP